MSKSEQQQLQAIALGDANAFARWLTTAEPRLRDSLSSFAAQVDVEAVVQETLLRAWQVAPKIKDDGKGECLLRLSIRIGRNLAIDETRRQKRHTKVSEEAPELSVDLPKVRDPFLLEIIQLCQEHLPKKPALALSARLDSQGATDDASLADSLGMRLNTFLQNLSRARKHLLGCLEEKGVPTGEISS